MNKELEKKIAKIVKAEIDKRDYEDTAWLKALKKAKGNEQEARGYYIEIRSKDIEDDKEMFKKQEKELLDVEHEYSYNRKKGFVLEKSTPIYKIGKEDNNLFFYSVGVGFNNFANFEGRTPRYQYWFFILFCITASAITAALDKFIFGTKTPLEGPLSIIAALIFLVPAIAIYCRRLHDTGRSGWWQLIVLIPLIGIIILLAWTADKGDSSTNKYGKPSNVDVGPVTFTDGLFYIILSIALMIYSFSK